MINCYEAVVIGSGHAGCEAALALARKGINTVLLTMNLDSIAFLACNPSIGGTAKGHLVCEIDALGGQMGIIADKTLIQKRMLNSSKGPAVQSLRAQVDKVKYHIEMKKVLEKTKNLSIRQAEAKNILVKEGCVAGVETVQGETYNAKAVVVCTGVYLKSKIIIGENSFLAGPSGFAPANTLTQSLMSLGICIKRFKTGTPVRIHANTVDFSVMEVQKGDENIQNFSFLTLKTKSNKADCFLTYTNKKTHEIIKNNLHRAPMYSGKIDGVGARYCPSIEDKVVRFSDKERHQLFLEPESLTTKEYYLQGLSTSMPIDVQKQMVTSIKGLERAHIMRDAYAIEYDCIESTELNLSLEHKEIKGLFFAGQVNGTSGYEEAAAQGLMAGLNAALKLKEKPPLILNRDQAYIGVLIDDLVTKGTNEPYRMMTSRAEYRLNLRQDNADMRLTQIGYEKGLVSKRRCCHFKTKLREIDKIVEEFQRIVSPKQIEKLFKNKGESLPKVGIKIIDIFKRNNINHKDIVKTFPEYDKYSKDAMIQVEIASKYEGYLKRQEIQINQAKNQESILLSENIDYLNIKGLRIEARQKLNKIKPLNLGQASRISGVSPADIAVLTVYIKSCKQA